MAATNGTVAGVYSGATFALAFTNPQGLDVLQVVNEGGSVVWNLTSAGVASANPAHPTVGALTVYEGQSLATAFSNPSSLDILQIFSPTGDALVFRVDSAGVTHTS